MLSPHELFIVERMDRVWTRRGALLGLAAGIAVPQHALALDRSPMPRPRPTAATNPAAVVQPLIKNAGLTGRVSYVVADAETGRVLAEEMGRAFMPPASTAKAVTALYALDALGPNHRFETSVIATGPVTDGRLEGDLVLAGSGDPLLDSDALGRLAEDLAARGLREVAGRFLIYDAALPRVDRIVSEQPETAGYNPTITGLNLNFNRVHFEWKRAKSDYTITMQARAETYRPSVTISTMDIVEERMPVFTYRQEDGQDRWTVARSALGNEGARWLPVRRPVAYAGEAFRAVAASKGLKLPPAFSTAVLPAGAVLARHSSVQMTEILEGMLRYSTNLTAEVAGLNASAARGEMPDALHWSAAEMGRWAEETYAARNTAFVDHSGLGYKSRMTAVDMVKILSGANGEDALRPIMRPFRMDKDAPSAEVLAKTGTHNFVSALAGYIDRPKAPRLAFAIFCGDPERRNAVPLSQRERPRGARTYANRARALQRELLSFWTRNLNA